MADETSHKSPLRFDSTISLDIILTIVLAVGSGIWAASGWKTVIDGKLDEHTKSFQKIEDREQAVENQLRVLNENYHGMDTRLTAQLTAVQATLGSQGSRDAGTRDTRDVQLPSKVIDDLHVIASSSDKASGDIDALRQAVTSSRVISDVGGKVDNIGKELTDIKKNLQAGVQIKEDPGRPIRPSDQALAGIAAFADSVLNDKQLSTRQKTQILRDLARRLAQAESTSVKGAQQ